MAAPGTNSLDQHDKTNKQKVEYWSLTTQPGGVELKSTMAKINFAHATLTQYVATPVSLSVVTSSAGNSVTVYSTSATPLTVDVMLIGV